MIEADELGIKYPKNIKEETLQAKVDAFKAEANKAVNGEDGETITEDKGTKVATKPEVSGLAIIPEGTSEGVEFKVSTAKASVTKTGSQQVIRN